MMAWNMSTLVLFNIVTLAEKATGSMANNKIPNEKQPGENPEGKYHYNPGNMAGKSPETRSRLTKIGTPRLGTKKSPPDRPGTARDFAFVGRGRNLKDQLSQPSENRLIARRASDDEPSRVDGAS